MKKQEKDLFFALCRFRDARLDPELLDYATPHVLGLLFFNRMQGIAYSVLRRNGLLGRVNREFRNSLRGAYGQNLEKNRSFSQCVRELSRMLADMPCRVAMLKGAYLTSAYPEGCRTSNDIDLLVSPRDVTEVGRMLSENGFRQGNIQNGVFVAADRQEIVASRMLRGETVPYIKRVGLAGMEFLEVDLNFSLDYKNGDGAALESMLGSVERRGAGEFAVPTLCATDFLIHLCCHLYKEATTLPWVEMKRDMTLYKYADIYMLTDGMSEKEIGRLFARARELSLSPACGFAVLQTAALFDIENPTLLDAAREAVASDPDVLHRVLSPSEGKSYLYTVRDLKRRFFADDRRNGLTVE